MLRAARGKTQRNAAFGRVIDDGEEFAPPARRKRRVAHESPSCMLDGALARCSRSAFAFEQQALQHIDEFQRALGRERIGIGGTHGIFKFASLGR